MMLRSPGSRLFFFNDTAPTEIYPFSLPDALPISWRPISPPPQTMMWSRNAAICRSILRLSHRSEEHTSELQSQSNLVCRLLLEKKKRDDSKDTSLSVCTK